MRLLDIGGGFTTYGVFDAKFQEVKLKEIYNASAHLLLCWIVNTQVKQTDKRSKKKLTFSDSHRSNYYI